jgi:hypothetical protein
VGITNNEAMIMKKMAIVGLCLFIVGCAPIKETVIPATPLGEKVERELGSLSRVNPILSDELRRLPELRRGLDEKGTKALNRLVKLYTQSTNTEVKQMFDRLLSIGKKEKRKFSSPLQALFWLVEEKEIPVGGNLLKANSILIYGGFNRNMGEDEDVITFVYNIWRDTYSTDKWKDPKEIIDRLNSPHLFDIFFQSNIAYDMRKSRMKIADRQYYENWGRYLQSATETIEKRTGVCDDATNLADEILSKAGYNVMPLQVKFNTRVSSGSQRHTVGVLNDNGLFYKIADDYKQYDGIVGPFKSIKDIGIRVAEIYNTTMDSYSTSYVPIR